MSNASIILPSGILVTKTRILGTATRVHAAYLPIPKGQNHLWSTHITHNGQWYGRIGTDPDRTLFEHLPKGTERSRLVREAYNARYAVAYAAIREAFPGIRGAMIDGEIETQEE